MGEAVVERLQREKFLIYWPRIEQELKTVPHIWSDWWTLDAIKEATIQGNFQCWAAGTEEKIDIVCWTQITYYPAGTVLQVFLAIGRGVENYIGIFDSQVEKFAHDMNCSMIEVTGRPGWAAKLKKIGFKQGTTHMTRRVENWRLH